MKEWTSECGTVRLICGNCLKVLPKLEDQSVDAVVTDPPYGNNYSTGYRQSVSRSNTKIDNDFLSRPLLNDTAAACRPLLNDAAAACRPLLNDAGIAYWFAAPNRLDWVLPIIRETMGLNVPNVLCWDKGNCSAGDLEATYGKQWEAIVWGRMVREPLFGGRDRDVIKISRGNTGGYVHPTQKPVELMVYLLGRHPNKHRIIDPFMGSGTTGVACAQTGRNFIGIELDAGYFEIARRRIQTTLAKRK